MNKEQEEVTVAASAEEPMKKEETPWLIYDECPGCSPFMAHADVPESIAG
jgi:hypothetical protein